MRFLAGFFILLLALFLQFFLISVGISVNLALAVLIAFAFVFSFAELLVFDLCAVFIINWQPAPSIEIVAFALIPLAVYYLRRLIRTEPWGGVLGAIVFGFFAFYLAVVPGTFFHHLPAMLEDFAVGAIVGEAIIFGLG